MDDTPMSDVAAWTATGSVDDCLEHLIGYEGLGLTQITLRIASWDQLGQLELLIGELLPRFNAHFRLGGDAVPAR